MSDVRSELRIEDRLAARAGQRVWLRVGKLFDGSEVLHDAHLVYDAEAIRYVGASPPPHDLLPDVRHEPDVTLDEFTALPGLIEAHAHLFLDGAPLDFEQRKAYLQLPAETMLQRARQRMDRLANYGVTAIRDAGDRVGVGLALARADREKHHANWPLIDSPGAAIHHQGRYGAFMAEPVEKHASPAAAVADRVAAGADRITLTATGIINFDAGQVTTPPQMTAAELEQFRAAAHAHGRQTFAHASGSDGIENLIAARIDSVEHGFFVTDDQLARMRDLQIAWCPTFAPVQVQIDEAKTFGWRDKVVAGLQRIIDAHYRALVLAAEIGVPIIAGSDAGSCGVPHGHGFLTELELMQRAGLSTQSVLRCATSTSADKLALREPIGRLAPGFRSRFILTRHAVLHDIAHLRRDKWLIHDSRAIHAPPPTSLDGL
jgi:imidazolonepropionase-like amidohydrolase